MSEFAALLREHRLAAGLNQSELAYLADCDQTYVGLLERGAREPSRRAVLALALVLDLATSQTDRLLFAAGYRPLTDYQALWERFHPAVEQQKWCWSCQSDLPTDRFARGQSACRDCRAVILKRYRARVALRDRRSA